MPRNGSGVYGPPAGTTATPNTPIESAKYNAYVADNAEAMTNSINVNGTAPFQANQPMGGFKLTNQGAGSAAGDSANLGQVQSGIVAHANAVAGTADAITANFTPAFTAYTAKMRFRFTAGATNATTTPTINVDGLGAKTIKKYAGAALAAGDIAGSGHVCECVYDGTDVLLLNPAISIPASSIGKQTIFVPASAMASRLTDGATFLMLESAGNKVNRQALVFPPSAAKYAQFGVAMPKSWNAGTVTARFLWEHPSAVTNFGVVWGIQGLSLADDDAFDNAFGSAVTVTDTGGTPADHYKSPETGAVTLSNSPAKGDTAIFQIYRDATAGADNLAVDAYLYGAELYLTTDAANDA